MHAPCAFAMTGQTKDKKKVTNTRSDENEKTIGSSDKIEEGFDDCWEGVIKQWINDLQNIDGGERNDTTRKKEDEQRCHRIILVYHVLVTSLPGFSSVQLTPHDQ